MFRTYKWRGFKVKKVKLLNNEEGDYCFNEKKWRDCKLWCLGKYCGKTKRFYCIVEKKTEKLHVKLCAWCVPLMLWEKRVICGGCGKKMRFVESIILWVKKEKTGEKRVFLPVFSIFDFKKNVRCWRGLLGVFLIGMVDGVEKKWVYWRNMIVEN